MDAHVHVGVRFALTCCLSKVSWERQFACKAAFTCETVQAVTTAVIEGIYFFDDVNSEHKGKYAEKSGEVERWLQEHVTKKIKDAADILFSCAITADDKIKMKEALKIPEKWAIEFISGKKGPGVSNQSNTFDFNLKKNGTLKEALKNVNWCK